MHSTSLPCTEETHGPPWPSTGGYHRCRRYIQFFPQHRCLAQTHEPHRSSMGIITPALGTAAVLSVCRHLTISFLLCFTSADVRISFCLNNIALRRHKSLIGLQRAQIFLHTSRLLFISLSSFHNFILASGLLSMRRRCERRRRCECEGVDDGEGVENASPPHRLPRLGAIFRLQRRLSRA